MRLAFPAAIGLAALLVASCSNSPAELPAADAPGEGAVAVQGDNGPKQTNRSAPEPLPPGHQARPPGEHAGHHKDRHAGGHGQPHGAGGKAAHDHTKSAHDHTAHSDSSGKKAPHTAGHHPETKKLASPAPRTRDWDWQLDRRVAEENNWIWTGSDLSEGFKQAAGTGKPLMVVVRCPP